MNRDQLLQEIRQVDSDNFVPVALEVFRYQAKYNLLYRRFLQLLAISPERVQHLEDIPFLPISLFKSHTVKTGDWKASLIFRSSGTTGTATSRHFLRDNDWYKEISLRGFKQQYDKVENYCILALLPSYLERKDSSLVFMVNEFIAQSKYSESSFFLKHSDHLSAALEKCKTQKTPTLLIGVSFALMDFAEAQPQDLSHCIIMETGGMKGRRKEIIRSELHDFLCSAFKTDRIHSEYGMTELLSQAYSKGAGIFRASPTMRLLCREMNDPFHILPSGKNGLLNIIDLGNVDTCSFIATDDVGRVYDDGSFEVLGRLDGSDMRGCNLMTVNSPT